MTRYRHVDGFKDGTDYIEIGPDEKPWAVTRAGKRVELSGYSRAFCKSRVEIGIWTREEIADGDVAAKERTP